MNLWFVSRYYTEFWAELQVELFKSWLVRRQFIARSYSVIFLLKACWFVVGQFIARSYSVMTCDESHYYKHTRFNRNNQKACWFVVGQFIARY